MRCPACAGTGEECVPVKRGNDETEWVWTGKPCPDCNGTGEADER